MPETKAIVREKNEGQVLFECSIEEMQKAYDYAKDMENMGLDVEVVIPDIHQTLANSLGATEEEQEEYLAGLEDEIDGHN